MGPHLVMFDRIHHPGAKHLKLEIGVVQSREQTRHTSGNKDDERNKHIAEVSLKDFGKRVGKEAQGIKSTATAGNVNGIVNASEELVQVPGVMLGALVLAQYRQVGGNLAI